MSTPWMKFYPTDWRGDQGLRAVSLAARGLWIEMLMIMHECNPYGYLVQGTRPVSTDVLSRMVGASPLEIEPLLAELETAGVFNRTERSGVIYSRRMTKDRQKANKCRKAAKTRWAQPTGSTHEAKTVENGFAASSPRVDPNRRGDQRTDIEQEKLRPNGSPNAKWHGSFEDDVPPKYQTEEGYSSSPLVDEAARAREREGSKGNSADCRVAYSETERRGLAFEFDGLDIDQGIAELERWCDRRGIFDPIGRKNAIYGALKKRYGKAKLAESLVNPKPVSVSPQLAASRLARNGR